MSAVINWLTFSSLHSADLDSITDFRIEGEVVTVEFAENPGAYYLLEYSADLINWRIVDASLGIASVLDIRDALSRNYFRAIPLSLYSPQDTDGDGMDDVYELNRSTLLDPLNPNDGSLDPDGNGLTTYQEYLKLFGLIQYNILQRETREWSLFNFGGPSARLEANSKEQSIFNFGSPSSVFESNSRELSVFNGNELPVSELLQVEARELSIFNFGQTPGWGDANPIAALETMSRELSVYNGGAIPLNPILQTEGRELSAFNSGSPSSPDEALSREVSVLNFEEP